MLDRRFVVVLGTTLALLVGGPIAPVWAQRPPSAPAADPQGKIVLIQGHVDSAAANAQEQWNPARLFQPLFVNDRVRTLTASRGAILFIDETQVKLNAGAVLTVQQIKTTAGTSTTLNLLEGEGWFRTKNPASGLTIKTPRAAASIRGTEIDIVVRGNDAVLTVTEGAAEFSNDAGSILVNAGEEATAIPGQIPTKRVLLNPEDAVQWVLYYPARVAWHDFPASARAGTARAGFDRLIAGDAVGAAREFQPTQTTDPWSRIGAAIALRQLGDPVQARTLLSGVAFTGEVEVERRTELAANALATGDAAAARAELEGVLSTTPAALRPLVMLAELQLTQNRKTDAAATAQRALAARPDSVAAHIAAAEAAQAAFDLATARRELDAAIAIDPDDVRALVDRARIRFGIGETDAARRDADRAAARAPADAQLRSLLGFIEMAAGDDAAARADFEAAVGSDAALGEPHLGLGLLHFRAGLFAEGLLEMLTATLLEPKVSLYQSYLGKAYYQLERFPEGMAALASAKHLDPRDPTPWLYSSFFLRDLNRQVDALEELRRAIALNDNRAVYRSRLLLDRDLATKNVSLAKLYNQLGFDAWGAYEALNSLNADLTNSSAHLFMSETYGNLPDRTQALSSELDQYFLYAPVNLNSFNNFSEYTSLFERPFKQLTVTAGGGNLEYGTATVRTQSGNERFAHTAFVDYFSRQGPRLDANDYRVQGTGIFKVSFAPSTNMFATVSGVRQVRGKDNDSVVSIGEFPNQVSVSQIVEHPDPTFTHRQTFADATVGFTHFWTSSAVFTMKSDALYVDPIDEDPDATFAACPVELGFADLSVLFAHSDSRFALPTHGASFQAQQSVRQRRHQLLFGGDYTWRRKTRSCHDFVTSTVYSGSLTADAEYSATERTAAGYVRDDIEVARWLHATIGARYVDGMYQDPGQTTVEYPFHRLNPYGGLSIRVRPSTSVHAAVFRNTNSDFLSSSIAPPTVAGFVLERNELPTSQRDEAAVAVQSGWRRSFLETRAFVRRTKAPAFRVTADDPDPFRAKYADILTPPDADATAHGLSVFFNQILTRRLALFADEQFITRDARTVDRHDNQVRLGINYIHPRGIYAKVATRFLKQTFSNTSVAGLPESSFALTDASVQYEFGRKRGLLTWSVTNLFDRSFRAIIENLAVESPLPHRTMVLTLRWRI
jgi:tetratricopeptide (TPR) repeat protein